MIKVKNLAATLILSSLFLVGCQSGGDGGEESEADTTEAVSSEEGEGRGAPGMEEVQPLTDVSDEDLEKFSQAVIAVQTYSQEVQPRMYQVVQESGMDPQRYSEIAQAQQMPGNTMEITAEEQANFDKAAAEVEELRLSVTDTMEIKIREAGLSVEEYRAIMVTVRQDPELQQKMTEIQQRQMGQNPPAGGM